MTCKDMPEGKRFKPGQSGNPVGRPKGALNLKKLIAKIWNEEIIDDDGVPRIRVLKSIKALMDKAEKGDVRAFRELADRIEGRPAQILKNEYESSVDRLLREALAKVRRK